MLTELRRIFDAPRYLIAHWPGDEHWTDADIARLVDIAAKHKLNPADILLVHLSEVPEKERVKGPSAWHTPIPGQTASGMMQWIKQTSESIGVNHDAIMQMSIAQQLGVLDKYLARYVAGRGVQNAADLYMVNFIGGLCKTESCAPKQGSKAYEVNRYLDGDGDGDVDISDLAAKLAKLADAWAKNPLRRVY